MKRREEQDQDEIIRRLKMVEQVEPSIFLFAKIRHKIEERRKGERNAFSPRFAWRMAAVFVILALVNVFVLFISPEEIAQETSSVAEELGLVSDNYYDNY